MRRRCQEYDSNRHLVPCGRPAIGFFLLHPLHGRAAAYCDLHRPSEYQMRAFGIREVTEAEAAALEVHGS